MITQMQPHTGTTIVWLGFLADKRAYEMGVPAIPLGDLYGEDRWKKMGDVRLHFRMPVDRIVIENGRVSGIVAGGETHQADYYVSSLPFERLASVIPELPAPLDVLEHSPITGIHLWFDRSVTDLPHGTLLERNIQWFFNKGQGRYIQLVVSASRSLIPMARRDVIDLALRELAEFLPAVKDAKLEKAHVVKEARATFSAKPGLEARRPLARTQFPNLFLAGDWTRTGWPATMEGAVKSGYLAAEAISKAEGRSERFVQG